VSLLTPDPAKTARAYSDRLVESGACAGLVDQRTHTIASSRQLVGLGTTRFPSGHDGARADGISDAVVVLVRGPRRQALCEGEEVGWAISGGATDFQSGKLTFVVVL
jgi:hypothetical protein